MFMPKDVEPILGVIYPDQVRDSKHHTQTHSRVGLKEKGCLSLFNHSGPNLVVMRRKIRRKRSRVVQVVRADQPSPVTTPQVRPTMKK